MDIGIKNGSNEKNSLDQFGIAERDRTADELHWVCVQLNQHGDVDVQSWHEINKGKDNLTSHAPNNRGRKATPKNQYNSWLGVTVSCDLHCFGKSKR